MDAITAAAIVQAIAAVATLGAAVTAAYVAWKAPERAARLAEHLRTENERARLRRDEKLRLFYILMNHRGRNISAVEPVDALNMINVVFFDSRSIKEAFNRFMRFINGAENRRARSDAYMDILLEIARDLGFPSSLTGEDLDRGYFPLPAATPTPLQTHA